jgi:mono/diheme cytochrome c family protein
LAAAVAALAVVAAMMAWWRSSRRAFIAYRLLLVFAALAVGAAGHFGAALVHGGAYIGDALALLREPSEQSGVEVRNAQASPQAAETLVDFARDVRPIFARRCFACHSGDEPAGDLNLDDRANLLAGGASQTPALTPGDATHSRLITLVTHGENDLIMPPKGARLNQDQVAIISRWIDQGA